MDPTPTPEETILKLQQDNAALREMIDLKEAELVRIDTELEKNNASSRQKKILTRHVLDTVRASFSRFEADLPENQRFEALRAFERAMLAALTKMLGSDGTLNVEAWTLEGMAWIRGFVNGIVEHAGKQGRVTAEHIATLNAARIVSMDDLVAAGIPDVDRNVLRPVLPVSTPPEKAKEAKKAG